MFLDRRKPCAPGSEIENINSDYPNRERLCPPNLHLLCLLTTVFRHGSFSRAAEVFIVGQPAIELQGGCRLLKRFPKGVVPRTNALLIGEGQRSLSNDRRSGYVAEAQGLSDGKPE
jgi:hypothetical protein